MGRRAARLGQSPDIKDLMERFREYVGPECFRTLEFERLSSVLAPGVRPHIR
jgi:hypothetical protein